ncbi:MAG: hypothetical protein RSH52_35445, partial [Janthinobacterium sp.]
ALDLCAPSAPVDVGQKITGPGHVQAHFPEMPLCLMCIKMLHCLPAIMASNSLPFQWSASAPAPSVRHFLV